LAEENMTPRPSEPIKAGRFGAQQLSDFVSQLFDKGWFCCFCLVAVGCLVRTPALQGPFIWDDNYLATVNPFIKSPVLILESFRHYLFLDSYSTHYRPVQNISFMPDYYWWGDNPFGFHLANIGWHVAAGVMLFFLLRRVLADLPLTQLTNRSRHLLAFLLALLWVVHPVHSAAVDYISGRADSLSFFFAASAWLTVLSGQRLSSPSGRAATYFAAFLLGLLALCSRESALIWVVLFLAHHLLVDRRTSRTGKIAVVIAGVTLVATYAGLRHLPGPRAQTLVAPDWSPASRAVLMLRALGDYARLMIVPTNLHMERTVFDPTPLRDSAHWLRNPDVEYLSLLGLGTMVALVIGILRKEPGRDLRIVGAGWFILSYLPTSNLMSLNATVAEHWLYLPSVGFLLFVAGCVFALPQHTRKWAIMLSAVFAVALGGRSYDRSADWSSAEKFFQQTLAAGGSSRAAVNLALIYSRRGEYPRAERLLRRVLVLTPDDPIARNNIADALRHLGRAAEAEQILLATKKEDEKIRKDYPRTWVVAANLARLRHAQKNDTAAFALLDEARKEYPDVWELVSYEAELLREEKGPVAAQKLVEQFARRNWWHYGATLALGRICAEKGNAAEATAVLTRASWLDLRDVEALNLIAQIRVREHRLNDAYLAQRKATDRQPDAPRQYTLLSDILEKMGRTAEARDAQAEGQRLQELARQNQSLLN
jgi:tetratricopeptide (TPR) repeat protein